MIRWIYSTSRRGKILTFFLTFLSYVAFHATRKSFSNIKANLNSPVCKTNETVFQLEEGSSNFYCCTGRVAASQCRGLFCALQDQKDFKLCDSWFGNKDYTEKCLSLMDTMFLLLYSIGLYFSGFVEDRLNKRIVLAIGMLFCAFLTSAIGIFGYMNIRTFWPYCLVWALNGLIQSCGWPGNVAIMGNWLSKEERGGILGIWSGNASVGNIVGANMVALILGSSKMKGYSPVLNSGDWRLAILSTGIFLAFSGFLMFLLLVVKPSDVGLIDPNEEQNGEEFVKLDDNQDCKESDSVDVNFSVDTQMLNRVDSSNSIQVITDCIEDDHIIERKKVPISFWAAWLVPTVFIYALTYAHVKLVNYCLFFWLPYYLDQSIYKNSTNSSQKADSLSQLYDWGCILGGAIGGVLSDQLGKKVPWRTPIRGIVTVCMIIPAIPVLFLIPSSTISVLPILVGAGGTLIGGAATLISSSISADLAFHPSLQNTEALGTVTGIIDGTGSVGAAIGPLLVYALTGSDPNKPNTKSGDGGWHSVFMMLMICLFIAVLLLSKIAIRDVRDLCFHRRQN